MLQSHANEFAFVAFDDKSGAILAHARKPSFSKKSYRERHRIVNAFCRFKDFRRIATRYDRLAINFAALIYLVAAVVWWML